VNAIGLTQGGLDTITITKTDKHQLEQIGQSNFKQVAAHNWRSIAKQTIEVYKNHE
jgi:hypothetical protein